MGIGCDDVARVDGGYGGHCSAKGSTGNLGLNGRLSLVPGNNSVRARWGVSAVLIRMTGAKQGVARVESAGWREGKSGASDAQAHTLAVESVSRLAPDSTQAARQYR